MNYKELPHSVEAEQGVLSSAFIDPKCMGDVVQEISKEHFAAPAHQIFYTQLVEAWQANEAYDLISFTQRLRDKGILDNIGGAAFVTSVYLFVPTSSGLQHYLQIVKDKYLLRETILACNEAIKEANEDQDEVPALVERLQSRFLALTDAHAKEHKTIKELAIDALGEIQLAHENHGKIPGLSTGLIDLDRKLGGMRPTQLIIIAGETGQGKTALSLNIAQHNAIEGTTPVGIVSLEMSGQDLSQRLIASVGKIDLHAFTIYGGQQQDFQRITSAVTKIAESKLHIRDDSDVDPIKLRAIGRQMRHENKIQLLIVDYIQLLTPQATKDENRERAMATAAHALKQMAKELGIVVIGLSQLNEAGRLRESRAIGHHADAVLTISHEDDESFIHINKNRTGPTGSVPVTFRRPFARFESAARPQK